MLSMVLDIGILVLEGRLPDRTSKRGYIEGPHCVLYPRTQAHRCDCSNYMVRSRIQSLFQFFHNVMDELAHTKHIYYVVSIFRFCREIRA